MQLCSTHNVAFQSSDLISPIRLHCTGIIMLAYNAYYCAGIFDTGLLLLNLTGCYTANNLKVILLTKLLATFIDIMHINDGA